MSGFALMHRAALDHPLFKGDSARLGAWFWLVSRACWKPTPFNISGKMVTLDRGQLCVSIRTLADEWGWSKSSVDRFITRLKTETMIETEAGQGRLIITICNYSKYQDREEGDRDSSGTPTGTAAGQQRDIKEQGNKGTRVEERADALSSLRARKAAGPHPIPDGWVPEPFDRRSASRKILDGWPPGEAEHQIEQFKAYHGANATRFVNWQQAWATWVLNSRNFGHGNRKSNHHATRDNRDGLQRYLDEKLGIGEA